MNTKKISMKINPADIRPLVMHSISQVVLRHSNLYAHKVERLQASINSGYRRQILESLKEIYEVYDNTKKELDNLVPLILELEEALPPGAEVLKDSLDLKEDGFGVDGGSK